MNFNTYLNHRMLLYNDEGNMELVAKFQLPTGFYTSPFLSIDETSIYFIVEIQATLNSTYSLYLLDKDLQYKGKPKKSPLLKSSQIK